MKSPYAEKREQSSNYRLTRVYISVPLARCNDPCRYEIRPSSAACRSPGIATVPRSGIPSPCSSPPRPKSRAAGFSDLPVGPRESSPSVECESQRSDWHASDDLSQLLLCYEHLGQNSAHAATMNRYGG